MVPIAISTPLPLIDGPRGKRLGFVTTEFHRARANLRMPLGRPVAAVEMAGLPIDEARCAVVTEACKVGAKYLFFVDWDVILPQDALCKLIFLAENRPDVDVFAGLYCLKTDPPAPLLWKEWGRGLHYDWTVGDLVDCVAVPAGCTLYRMGVFDKVEEPWFKTTDDLTEDMWFCKRASEAGVKMIVDTSILCGHIDNETGIIYGLSQDSLPWKRYLEKQGEQAKCGS